VGVGSEFIEVLISLRTSGLLNQRGAVMEIGAQQLANSFLGASDRLMHLGKVFGIDKPPSLPPPKPSYLTHEPLEITAPFSRDFWHWLGFDYAAIDIDGSAGSIPLDLNYDSVPAEAEAKYDIVTNFGTTEHVVNQLNAFKVIHELTCSGGIMVHVLPAQGMLNHGLVNYNLKFFWMLARSNGYTFIQAHFSQAGESHTFPKDIADFLRTYDPFIAVDLPVIEVVDMGVLVVLQKSFNIPFVPPIDVATGTQTNIDSLKKRYWTVFDPGAFDRLISSGAGPVGRKPANPAKALRRLAATAKWATVRCLAIALKRENR
jgi:hypothetical protein